MDLKFIKGDIVKFIDEDNVRPDYLLNIENIYQIASIEGSKVVLSGPCSNIETDISAITGVKMDGKEDISIYYDPAIMASIVAPGDPIPIHRRDYTYYLDACASFRPNNKTMRDFIEDNNFLYVHELQHYLREHYQHDYLKIRI